MELPGLSSALHDRSKCPQGFAVYNSLVHDMNEFIRSVQDTEAK